MLSKRGVIKSVPGKQKRIGTRNRISCVETKKEEMTVIKIELIDYSQNRHKTSIDSNQTTEVYN